MTLFSKYAKYMILCSLGMTGCSYSNATPAPTSHLVPSHYRQHVRMEVVASDGIYKKVSGKLRKIGRVRPKEIDKATHIGAASKDQKLHFTIELGIKNEEAFADHLHQIYTPGSPLYGKFLKTGEFAALYEPSQQEKENVVSRLKIAGIETNQISGRHLKVNASVSTINKFFNTEMHVYKHIDDTHFLAPSHDLQVSSELDIVNVMHMDTIPRKPKHMSSNLPFNPIFLRSMYTLPAQLTGAGQTVAVNGAPFDLSDIVSFENTMGLKTLVPIKVIVIDGLGSGNTTVPNPDVETTVDISTAIAIAPGLKEVIVYEAGGVSVTVFNQAAIDNIAQTVSTSYVGGDGESAVQALNVILQQMAAQGQSAFVASGDAGCWDLDPRGEVDPTSQPFITAVGGTVKGQGYVNGVTPDWPGENGWSQSGGGVSNAWPIPSYQIGANPKNPQVSKKMRNVPDVSAFAGTHYTPWYYIFSAGQDSGPWSGTSISSPLWAAFTALVNQNNANLGKQPMGFLNPTLYKIGLSSSYQTAFHDIADGSWNSYSNPAQGLSCAGFNAVPGYDLITGWGSPNGTNLIQAMSSYAAPIVSPSPSPSPSPTIVIAVGTRPTFTSLNGVTWVSDSTYNTGGYEGAPGKVTILNCSGDCPVYQSERIGNILTYNFSVPNGKYAVILKFAELYWTSVGERLFNVSLNGLEVLSNFDLFKTAGHLKAYDVSFPVTVTAGKIELLFTAIKDYAKIDGIEILSIP